MKNPSPIPDSIKFVVENGKQVCHVLTNRGVTMKVIDNIRLNEPCKSYQLK